MVIESGIEELRSQSEAAREVIQAFSVQPGQSVTPSETCQTLAKTAIAAQERSVNLAQTLFESGIEELEAQAESTQAIMQTLA